MNAGDAAADAALRELAKAAKVACWKPNVCYLGPQTRKARPGEIPGLDFNEAVSPDVVLGLLARVGQAEAERAICGMVCTCGPNLEPLACGYRRGHDGVHSWASLPTFVDGKTDGERLAHSGMRAQRSIAHKLGTLLDAAESRAEAAEAERDALERVAYEANEDCKRLEAELEELRGELHVTKIDRDDWLKCLGEQEWLAERAEASVKELRAALAEVEEEILYVLDEFNRGDTQDAEEGARKARGIARAVLARVQPQEAGRDFGTTGAPS